MNISGVNLEPIMISKIPAPIEVESGAMSMLNKIIHDPANETCLETFDAAAEVFESRSPNFEKVPTKPSAISHDKKLPEKHTVLFHSKPRNDYNANPELLSKSFPTLFPLGVTEKDLGSSGPLSAVQRKTLLLFYDRRFATNLNFTQL